VASRRQFHLARVRYDRDAARGWCYASLCEAVPRAGSLRGLTNDPEKVTCPYCRRWIPPNAQAAQGSAADIHDMTQGGF